MLTCQQLTELVTDYVEGQLSLPDRVRFNLHIAMCRHCRAYVRDRKLAIKTLGSLPVEPIPDEVKEDLMARFRDWKGGPRS